VCLCQVFLRAGQMALLDKVRTDTVNKAATRIQQTARGLLARIYVRRVRQNIITLQGLIRGWAARKELLFLRSQQVKPCSSSTLEAML
jgi:myosin V